MTRQRALIVGGIAAAAAALAWVLFVALPRRAARSNAPSAAAAPTQAPAGSGRKIKARLFYVAQDGIHLTHVERDVPYGEGTLEQAREIVAAQMAPVSQPLLSAIPAGTTVRALFLSEAGDAYVDFSREIVSGHTGGTGDELLTIYTIVHALTENLPAVTGVQVLVDGKEVDTLAGHVDLRNPLGKNLALVQ
jgi:spore germination protein GerM